MNEKQLLINSAIEGLKCKLSNSVSNSAQAIKNASGIEQFVTTLTAIRQKVTEQKFYEVRPSDFMAVAVGSNPYMVEEQVWTEEFVGEDLEAGLTDYASGDSKLTTSAVKYDRVLVVRKYWKEAINYDLLQLNTALTAGNFSFVESKERARFKRWQLLIQKTAFVGLTSDSNVKGLLTQDTVNSNTTLITKKASAMTPEEFQALLAGLLPAYKENSNYTVDPDTLIIPADDFNGLGSSVDEAFPLKSRLARLREAMVEITGNANFQIKPLVYAQASQNPDAVNRWVMYTQADNSALYMDIPVDYTTTIADTVNGFSYSSVGYGQFSGCNVLRPLEVLYFDWS